MFDLAQCSTLDTQPFLHLLERDALGFRHHELHPEQLEHHHAAEKEEDAAGRKDRNHFGKKGGQERGKDPMGGAAQGLALGAIAVGEDFGDKYPDDGTLAHGMRGDEREDTGGDDAEMQREKGPGRKSQGKNVAKGANEKEGAPTQPVDQPQANKSEDQIRDANADGLQERRFGAQAGHFKNTRGKIKDGIDAG